VPVDQKPCSGLLVALVVYQTLKKLKLKKYPTVNESPRAELLKIRKLLEQN
jgi:hypothetical protein